MLNLKYILQIFETISGLRVNLQKSSLVGIKVDKQETIRFANLLGCKVEKLPLKYLGFPLGGQPRSVAFWNPTVERIQKKLAC